MSLEYKCGSCGTLIQVPGDAHADQGYTCPTCGQVVVPTLTPPAAPMMTPPLQSSFSAPPVEQGRKGLAIAAMCFGIFGLCFAPAGLVALILGIIALSKANSRPQEYAGKGPAIVGICTGGAGLLLMIPLLLFISILLPSLARARELSKRTVCHANLHGMGMGFYTYANENADNWPIATHLPATGKTTGLVDYTQAIGSYRAQDLDRMSPPPGKLSTTRNLWTLVRTGVAAPGSFICPSSGDVKNNEDDPQIHWDFGAGQITGAASVEQARAFWSQVSYGYQVPYGKFGRPSTNCDLRMALAADKGPFGAAVDGGKTSPPAISATASSGPDDWRRWNSPNHGGVGDGEGQVVLYTDGHADFQTKPTAGVKMDNIYTQWSGNGVVEAERIHGSAPTANGRETPAGDSDSLIYP